MVQQESLEREVVVKQALIIMGHLKLECVYMGLISFGVIHKTDRGDIVHITVFTDQVGIQSRMLLRCVRKTC